MRRLAPIGLGLLLALPASAEAQLFRRHQEGGSRHEVGHLCAECASKLPKRVPADGSGLPPSTGMPTNLVVMGGTDCLPCQAAAANGSQAIYLTTAPEGSQMPGVAYVGGDQAPGAGHGYGPVEPAPIGVMRTNYSSAANPGMGASPYAGSSAAYAGSSAPYVGVPMGATAPQGLMAGMPGPEMPGMDMMSGSNHRHRFLARILGVPSFRDVGAAGREQARVAHAQLRYGQGGPAATSVPASMVYGR